LQSYAIFEITEDVLDLKPGFYEIPLLKPEIKFRKRD